MTRAGAAYITGLGVVSALGAGKEATRAALLAGQPRFSEATLFDMGPYRTRLAGQVTTPLQPTAPGNDRSTQMALIALREALQQAGVTPGSVDPERTGTAFGTCFGSDGALEDQIRRSARGEYMDPRVGALESYFPALAVARATGAAGPFRCVGTACAAGLTAIGIGLEMIRSGLCDMVVAGGADALNEVMFSGFSTLRALSPTTCRPFDENRDGLLLGEGAAIMVLESPQSARRRGVSPIAQILGYGLSNDAYHPTAPDPEGGGAIRAMDMALTDAGITPADVDYVNAHGTGTPHNDQMEVTAIRKLLGAHADGLKVSALKSMTGHTMGAAGALAVAVTAMAIQGGFLPPTCGLQDPIDAGIDFVPQPRTGTVTRIGMCNAFAFGGHCATVIIGQADL
jgi:3-oxoacyl-[acyl-carrier-protein] synthase II